MAMDGSMIGPVREAGLAWRKILGATPAEVAQAVSGLIASGSPSIADEHYEVMLSHDRARDFLDHEIVNQRLHRAMQRWLARTFGTLRGEDVAATVAHHVEVGELHARIRLPPDLMSVAVRVLKEAVLRRVFQALPDPAQRLAAALYVNDVIHLADSVMNCAYVATLQRSVRNDEAYRAVALRHDAALERERQRAALSEWAQKFPFAIGRRSRREQALRLGQSEFALWLKHKAQVLFEGMPDVQHVHDAIAHVDEVLIPQLMAPDLPEDRMERLVEALEQQMELIRYLVGDLFERLSQVEHGRDSVTRLFNRRYLHSILSRELEEHRRNAQPFCIMMVGVDGLASLAGDGETRNLVLQRAALALQGAVRSGDHAFRYGEDEFVVIAVESNERDAAWTAERIRSDVRAQTVVGGGGSEAVRISIGLAIYDGHPDYHYLLDRGQEALTLARARGGNCIERK